jgi:L-idonate 5-dehydrogenase
MLGMGCALLLSRMFGCADVYVHDLEPTRLDRAQAVGIHPLRDLPTSIGSDAEYAGLYAQEQFDLVVETTGTADALQQGLARINPGGTLVMLGFLQCAEIAPGDLVIKAARVVGSIGGSGSFEAVVPWLASHAGEARTLISHSFPSDRADAAFAAASNRREALKVQVRFP